jgi:hypothetical protein
VPAETLLNSLRIAALQGELSPHSSAPSAPPCTFPVPLEAILDKIAAREDCPVDKLRGWLLRALATLSPMGSPRSSPRTGASSPRGYGPAPAGGPATVPALVLGGVQRGLERADDDSARLAQTFSGVNLDETSRGGIGGMQLCNEQSGKVSWARAPNLNVSVIKRGDGARTPRSGATFGAWRPEATVTGTSRFGSANDDSWR